MNALSLKLNEIYQGKATMIKDKRFFSTQQYIEPFIDRVDKMCQGNFIIKAAPANQISLTPNGDIDPRDLVFNRVWVQGVLPGEYAYENHQQTINMLYALDTRKPLVKFFKSTINMACLNMCVFNPEHLFTQELNAETAINYGSVDFIMKLTDDTKVRLEELAGLSYTPDEVRDSLGLWIDRCIRTKYSNNFGSIKLQESMPIEVYKSIILDEKSPYFRGDKEIDGFTLYNAFTDIVSNDKGKDIVNKFEKTLLISNIIKNDSN